MSMAFEEREAYREAQRIVAAKRKPPPPRRGKRTKPTARHFRVGNVDLGDGKLVTVTLTISRDGILVRKFGSRRRWFVPMREAAGLIGRRGQVRFIERAQSFAERAKPCEHVVHVKHKDGTRTCDDCGAKL